MIMTCMRLKFFLLSQIFEPTRKVSEGNICGAKVPSEILNESIVIYMFIAYIVP